jgi:Na+/H+ antiporter NhaD/arsenite permease-like protein
MKSENRANSGKATQTLLKYFLLLAVIFWQSFNCVAAEPGLLPKDSTAPATQQVATPQGVDGRELALPWSLPFIGILLSIALMPLLAPHFWHHHFGKVSLFWSLCFLLPFLAAAGARVTAYELLHVAFLEYFPFIILLFALFTIAGGVRLTGTLPGTPIVNTGMLAFGTLIASCMGTTGAAMLLIRPMIASNQWRKRKVHTIVFFIFLVANIGGSLTPLGDPPLFLGFLKGVSFFWPTTHLLLPMLLTTILLLGVYYVWDSILVRTEIDRPPIGQTIGLEGKLNIFLLTGVVAAVLLSGIWKPTYHWPAWAGVHIEPQNAFRDLILLCLAAISWKWTASESRLANGFSWFPIVEVAKLFAGIFVTIIPVIAILKAGSNGALSKLVELVSVDGQSNPAMYFWLTGALSSFLDNAPTYLVFFNTAGGDPRELMREITTLVAISGGAVFFGAMTYIGNAPNFMVRSIAEERGIKMPSFFGYLLYSVVILLPVFALITWIWFRK